MLKKIILEKDEVINGLKLKEGMELFVYPKPVKEAEENISGKIISFKKIKNGLGQTGYIIEIDNKKVDKIIYFGDIQYKNLLKVGKFINVDGNIDSKGYLNASRVVFEPNNLHENEIKEAEEEKELPLIKITDEIRVKILDYLKNNEIKDDEKDVHKFAEELKINPHQLELEIYKIVQTFIRGGRAFEKGVTEKDVDPKSLVVGKKVEQEHLNSESPYADFLSSRISLDHFSESKDPELSLYYDFLLFSEKLMEKGYTVEDIRSKLSNL